MLYMHDPSYIESSINKFVSLGSVPNIAYAKFLPIQMLDKIYGLLEMSQPLTKALIFDEGKRKMLSDICQKSPIICKNVFETSSSLEPTNRVQYETIFPFLYYYPAGTNSNTMLHWSQIHQEKKLVYFNPDYPTTKEAIPYDSDVIKNWKIKSFIQRSDCDTFSSYDDVTEFYEAVEDTISPERVNYAFGTFEAARVPTLGANTGTLKDCWSPYATPSLLTAYART